MHRDAVEVREVVVASTEPGVVEAVVRLAGAEHPAEAGELPVDFGHQRHVGEIREALGRGVVDLAHRRHVGVVELERGLQVVDVERSDQHVRGDYPARVP